MGEQIRVDETETCIAQTETKSHNSELDNELDNMNSIYIPNIDAAIYPIVDIGLFPEYVSTDNLNVLNYDEISQIKSMPVISEIARDLSNAAIALPLPRPPSSDMNIILGMNDMDIGYDLQEHNAICQMFDDIHSNIESPKIDRGWIRRAMQIYSRRYPLNYEGVSTEPLYERIVVIYGIPESCNEMKIVDAAREYGPVSSIILLEHPRTGRFIGIAICEFLTVAATLRCLENSEYTEYVQYPASMMLHHKIHANTSGIVTGAFIPPLAILESLPARNNSLISDCHLGIDVIYDIVSNVMRMCSSSICISLNDHFLFELLQSPALFSDGKTRNEEAYPYDARWVSQDVVKAMKWAITKNIEGTFANRPATTGRLYKKRNQGTGEVPYPKHHRQN